MGILSIDERDEFVARIADFADIAMTGGAYFVGMHKERTKLIQVISDIQMTRTPFGCCIDIGKCIEQVLGYKPLRSSHYQFNDPNDRCATWAFDFDMPKDANYALRKTIHVSLKFRHGTTRIGL